MSDRTFTPIHMDPSSYMRLDGDLLDMAAWAVDYLDWYHEWPDQRPNFDEVAVHTVLEAGRQFPGAVQTWKWRAFDGTEQALRLHIASGPDLRVRANLKRTLEEQRADYEPVNKAFIASVEGSIRLRSFDEGMYEGGASSPPEWGWIPYKDLFREGDPLIFAEFLDDDEFGDTHLLIDVPEF